MEQISAGVITTKQIGIDTWIDIYKTKVFDVTEPIENVLNWARTISPDITFSMIKFGDIQK